MTLSADGFYDKYYETSIKVDPDVIDKQPSPTPPRDGGDGDDGDDDGEPGILGYDLFIFVSMIFIILGGIYLTSNKKRLEH